MIKLSVLICSTHTRSSTFLPKMMESIFGQYNALPEHQQQEVEILILVDNKKMMLGEKRNEMVNMAQGEYVVFVDDDDRLESDYLFELIKAIDIYLVDMITFQVSVSLNGGSPKPCFYSKQYGHDENVVSGNEIDYYKRLPNHICCVRRELAIQAPFPSIVYGEDSGYSKLLKPLLKTEHKIDKVLYHYDFNSETTETQQHLNRPKRKLWGRRR